MCSVKGQAKRENITTIKMEGDMSKNIKNCVTSFIGVLLFSIKIGFFKGLEVIDDLLSSPVKKLCFVSIWFSFCVALFLLNR
jgi:hypothetical protein